MHCLGTHKMTGTNPSGTITGGSVESNILGNGAQSSITSNNSGTRTIPNASGSISEGTICSRDGLITEEYDPFASGCIECNIESIDTPLSAPPQKSWYHGRLGREEAEDRLRLGGSLGSYLVRESHRKPGSYVLSFLGKNGISHFRIIALCGDYYIGGRQFDSLYDLIGYYCSVSDLLKEERLLMPVGPPEPVNDERKVVAILPYTKLPETDELSFAKGEIFLVHNEIGDGWLWVTSVKSGQAGLVYQDLVEEMRKPQDPNEELLYYHGNITKQEAATMLMKNGQRSYLVRPSDSTPGDYVLFFLANNTVQRFKIQRHNNGQFFMGGRYFHSLSDVIDRYKSERIIEGFCLGSPVLRVLNNTDGPQSHVVISRKTTQENSADIYAAIQRSSGYHSVTTCTRGYLHKKSEKNKKWKKQFFILDSKEQQLYYFESEKRTKPKGMIDLSYSVLYPVHDSFFDRPNCFQVIVRSLNTANIIYYLCADSPDEAEMWMSSIKPLCSMSSATRQRIALTTNGGLKEMQSLQLQIIGARNLPSKLVPSSYCVVSLNDVKVCRTRLGQSASPLWEQDFLLDDLPSDVSTVTVTLFQKSRRSRDIAVAQVTQDMGALELEEWQDEWHSLNPPLYSDLKLPSDLGCLRLRLRYTHEVVMPLDEYSGLKELLLDSSLDILGALGSVCAKDLQHLAKTLLRLFRDERIETQILPLINTAEINKEESVTTLFRSTSLATSLMDIYQKQVAEYFVQRALADSVAKVQESKHCCELNPDKLERASELNGNVTHFLQLLAHVVDNIFRSANDCPPSLRYICYRLQKAVRERWPDDMTVKTRVVSSFIFLRLLCPALMNPRHFNLIQEPLTNSAARTLTLVTKAVQNLANLVEFGAKESYMEVVNPFITRYKEKMIHFLDELANVPVCPVQIENSLADPARDLATLHQICNTHLTNLQHLALVNGTVKRLITVTEILNTHRKHYLEERSTQRAVTTDMDPGGRQKQPYSTSL